MSLFKFGFTSTASKESATKGKGKKDGEKTDDVRRSNKPTKKTRTSQGSGDPDTVTVPVSELQEVYQLASPSCNVTMITESDKSTTSQISPRPSSSSSRMSMEVESGATSEEIEPANLGLESDIESSSSTDSDGKHQI